jgi:hypothetical protein
VPNNFLVCLFISLVSSTALFSIEDRHEGGADVSLVNRLTDQIREVEKRKEFLDKITRAIESYRQDIGSLSSMLIHLNKLKKSKDLGCFGLTDPEDYKAHIHLSEQKFEELKERLMNFQKNFPQLKCSLERLASLDSLTSSVPPA